MKAPTQYLIDLRHGGTLGINTDDSQRVMSTFGNYEEAIGREFLKRYQYLPLREAVALFRDQLSYTGYAVPAEMVTITTEMKGLIQRIGVLLDLKERRMPIDPGVIEAMEDHLEKLQSQLTEYQAFVII